MKRSLTVLSDVGKHLVPHGCPHRDAHREAQAVSVPEGEAEVLGHEFHAGQGQGGPETGSKLQG